PRLKRRYAIRDDIPIMLIDEAETVDGEEHDRLLAKAEAEGISPTFQEA
ncbi:MAG: Trm112 family protein, partial [Actinomycetota bacterium]|nr:Trm112 family protein [Actinomycetota bacterium]